MARTETALLALIVAIPMVFNAVTLLPELTSVPNVNDDAAHLVVVVRANDAISHGENPIDFWVPDLELGFPQFVYYQHLPHLAVVAIYRALLGSVDLVLVFNLFRYVLMVLLPVTVWWSMRTMRFGGVAAALGAGASSLFASGGMYGFDYDSYIWRGYGVFTQLAAMHVAFIALALLYRLLATGRGYLDTIVALAALALTHLLYAYMMAISGAILVLLAGPRRALPARLARITIAGSGALAIAAYMLVPAATTGQYLDVSPYLARYKYDSFGASEVLTRLVHGSLIDNGRLPVFTVALALGIVAALVTRTRPALVALVLFGGWLVLYFGRPTLGSLVDFFPFHQVLYFHRFIGGVHLAATFLIGVGGAWLWELLRPWRHPAALVPATAALVLALVPAMQERGVSYGLNGGWLAQTKAAIDRDADARAIFATLAALPPGRVYAGLRTDWAEQLDFGIPFRSALMYHLLPYREVPALTQPFQGLSLNADIAFDFDASKLSSYRIFGVSYVIAPSSRAMPDFLVALRRTSRYTLYGSPASAAARYAAVSDTVRVPAPGDLLPVIRPWVFGPDAAAGRVLRLEYPASPAGPVGRPGPVCSDGGTVLSERIEPSRVEATVSCASAATLVLNMTFHPNWQVTADGVPLATYMVSPSFIGVDLPPGQHVVVAEYRSTPIKAPLLVLGGSVLGAAFFGRRRLERADLGLVARWRLG